MAVMESAKLHYKGNNVPSKTGTAYWELKMSHIFLKSKIPNFYFSLLCPED